MDEYDKEAALLVCAVDFPVDKTRDRVAAALREAGKREADLLLRLNGWLIANSPGGWIDDLRREVERLTHELLVIGDMAVINFDDAVVGMADAVVKAPATYADKRRAELAQYKAMRAEIAALKAEVQRLTAEEQAWRKFANPMAERDEYDERAERLLSDWWNNHEDEPSLLFAIVAAALREAGKREAK